MKRLGLIAAFVALLSLGGAQAQFITLGNQGVVAAGGGATCAHVAGAGSTAPASQTAVMSLSNTANLTVAAGTNTALVCGLSWNTNPGTITASTYNGVSMPQIGATQGTVSFTAAFGQINPTPGSHNVSIAWTNSASYILACQEFSGVNQAGGSTTFSTASSTGTTATPTTTATVSTGDCAMDVMQTSTGTGVSTTTPTTQVANGQNVAATAFGGSLFQDNATAPSQAFAWHLFGSGSWTDQWVDIAQ